MLDFSQENIHGNFSFTRFIAFFFTATNDFFFSFEHFPVSLLDGPTTETRSNNVFGS